MNIISRLVGQAGDDLAGLRRRLIDDTALAVRLKIQEVIDSLTRAVTDRLRTLLAKAVVGLFAAVTAIVAVCYALAALEIYLARVMGPLQALLIMAGAFALLAVIATVVLLLWPRGKKPAEEAERVRRDAEQVLAEARAAAATQRAAETVAGAPPRPGEPLAELHSGLGILATALGEAGFKREQAGLHAGLALAERLRPAQLVSLALLGGFIAGLRISRR